MKLVLVLATTPVKVTCGPTRTDNGAVIEPSTTEKPGLSETTMSKCV